MAPKDKGGFSLAPSAQVATSGIGLGSGRAKAVKHKFGTLKYTGKQEGKKATSLIVTFLRGGEKTVENYTCGKGFKPSEDGMRLIALDGATGLNKSCKAALYLSSLKEHAQMPDDYELQPISNLDGLDLELVRKPMERGEGMTTDPTVLVADDVYAAPWKVKGGGKAKAEDAEAEEDDDDEEEEDGKGSKDKSRDDKDDDEDDEDDAPKKGKGKAAADDDEDDDAKAEADEDIDEIAGEALIDALDDGPLRASKIEQAVLAKVKKHKNAKAIAARAASPKFLKTEQGWSWDGTKAEKD